MAKMIENWPPTDPIMEEWIELEFHLKHCIQDIKTNIRCRREFLKHYTYEEPSDLFLDSIRENWKLKWSLRKQLFKLRLQHGDIWT